MLRFYAMPPLPLIEPNTALFLDFDGTLADLAPRPELVQVEPELVGTLRLLYDRLEGALAIVSGRRSSSSTISCSRCACRPPAFTARSSVPAARISR